MRSEVQIHLMLPIAGMQTLRELFANQYKMLVGAKDRRESQAT
jgi:hypothetical protein